MPTSLHTIETRAHGRYIVRQPDAPPPWPVIVGFHGYGESARDHLDALQTIPGTEAWLLVSVQALHPFYTRTERVVASWMTREDRALAIADNLAYVGGVIERIRGDYETRPPLVFSGFSQGGAMAYRAAAAYPAAGVVILAADVPPDVADAGGLPPVLIGRGRRDAFYTDARAAADRETLARLGAHVTTCVFDGGHEWTDPFRTAAATFLNRIGDSGLRRLKSVDD